MESNLLDTLNHLDITSVATELWGKCENSRLGTFNMDLVPFCKHYSRACRQALHDGGRHNAVRSHTDIIGVVQMLKSGMVREEIRTALRSKLTRTHENECELLDNAIDLAASLLLMCDFGATSLSFSGQTELRWTQGTLQKFMLDYFSEPPILSHEGMKLEKTFLARNMRKIGGIEIIWTEDLVDHLRLSDDDTKVHIFHHASFLEYQRQRRAMCLENRREEAVTDGPMPKPGKPVARRTSCGNAADARAAMSQHGPRDEALAGAGRFDRPVPGAMRPAEDGAASDRKVPLLAGPVGYVEAGVRRGPAKDLDAMVARSQERRAMVYLLGGGTCPGSHHCLWFGTERGRGASGLCIVQGY